MARKPSEKKLRLLAAVGDGRVRRALNGWTIAVQPAAGKEAASLRGLRELDWIRPVHEPQEACETAAVHLTDAGRDVLTSHWPTWKPADSEVDPERDAVQLVRRNPGITARSLELFLAYARDADNWSGTPLIGGNVASTAEDRGNLTQLKVGGLISTFEYNGERWIQFTTAGKDVAAEHGIAVDDR